MCPTPLPLDLLASSASCLRGYQPSRKSHQSLPLTHPSPSPQIARMLLSDDALPPKRRSGEAWGGAVTQGGGVGGARRLGVEKLVVSR